MEITNEEGARDLALSVLEMAVKDYYMGHEKGNIKFKKDGKAMLGAVLKSEVAEFFAGNGAKLYLGLAGLDDWAPQEVLNKLDDRIAGGDVGRRRR